jgi:hypothetical protein
MTNGSRRAWSNCITAIEKNARSSRTTRTGTRAAVTWPRSRRMTAVIGSRSATAVSPTVDRSDPPTTQAVAEVWNVWVPAACLARVVPRSGVP